MNDLSLDFKDMLHALQSSLSKCGKPHHRSLTSFETRNVVVSNFTLEDNAPDDLHQQKSKPRLVVVVPLGCQIFSFPCYYFAEGGMTNGTGMMKFSRGFLRFAHGLPVVPVALRASLPWSISTHTLNSSFLSNLFW